MKCEICGAKSLKRKKYCDECDNLQHNIKQLEQLSVSIDLLVAKACDILPAVAFFERNDAVDYMEKAQELFVKHMFKTEKELKERGI